MKNSTLIILFLIFLQSCSSVLKPDKLNYKIKKVETSLFPPVFIDGDSTWSIQKRMVHYGVPGVSIAVINDSKIEYTKSYGIMDKNTKSPVKNSTLFQAGSISKPVSAYAALKMVEQNKIDIDENINTYLKSWKLPDNEFNNEKKVTLKNILNHSAGITVHGFLGYSSDLPVPTLVEVLNGASPANSNAVLVNKIPGEGFQYSGGGYIIMQKMIMDIEDKKFPILMEELILQPLNMTNSTFDQPLSSEKLEIAATGYLPNGSVVKGKRFTYPELAAAGLWTTAEDLARFVIDIQQSFKGEKNTVISQSTTKEMLTPLMEGGGPALGLFISEPKNETYFFHKGWVQGFSSEFIAHRDKGYGVVVLTNSNHPEFVSELIRSVALTYHWDDYVTTFEKQNLDPREVEKIAGRYKINDENILEIYEFKGQLIKKNLGEKSTELVKISDTSYIVREDGARVIQFKINPETENFDMIIRYHSGYLDNTFTKMKEDERLPIEFLEKGNFEQALVEYQKLKNENHNNPAIVESNLNSLGYHFLNLNNLKLSQDIFKVNTVLYPKSSQVYDSYAEASMKMGDFNLALANYKKSLNIDPQNNNAELMIQKLKKKKIK